MEPGVVVLFATLAQVVFWSVAVPPPARVAMAYALAAGLAVTVLFVMVASSLPPGGPPTAREREKALIPMSTPMLEMVLPVISTMPLELFCAETTMPLPLVEAPPACMFGLLLMRSEEHTSELQSPYVI